MIRGLLVVAAAHGAGEAALADALAAAVPGGERFTALAPDRPASPLTAARHAGSPLDPAGLLAAIGEAAAALDDPDDPLTADTPASDDAPPRDDAPAAGAFLAITVAGGLLAPLTPRYAVRDLARDVGLPLVLAVPAGADAVNVARLSLESARGAGLAVAAVVLTGWPDPPDRVLLDERELLAELAGLPVAVFPPDAPLPVEAWLDAPAAPAAAGAEVVLDPYEAWQAREVGDPRSTPRPRIMEALLEIVAAEGPMTATRAYALYNRAAGGRKLTSIVRAPLSSALYWLAQEQRITLTQRDEVPWQDDDLVRTPETPAVHVRELGSRSLEEVPLDEIAELMRRLRAAQGVADEQGLKRAVLSAYGLVRLTARTDEQLGLALGLLD